MGTHGIILEGLREKRQAAVNRNGNTKGYPHLAYQVICERKWSNFIKTKGCRYKANLLPKTSKTQIKESHFKSSDEMPMGKLEKPVIIVYDGSGDRYIGYVRDGVPDGDGTMVSPDGEMYTGSWVLGRQHGWGYYLWADGRIYSGEWRYGVQHGKGVYSIDDAEYEVEYKNGKLISTESSITDSTAKKKIPK
jgi:hypothetical protein